jgi:hypothetical protein
MADCLVEYANQRRPRHRSIVCSSIASAIRDEFGDDHATDRTANAELFISPLMTLWLDALSGRNHRAVQAVEVPRRLCDASHRLAAWPSTRVVIGSAGPSVARRSSMSHPSPSRKLASGLRRAGTDIVAVARAGVLARVNARRARGSADWAALRGEELRRLADAMAGVGRVPGVVHIYGEDDMHEPNAVDVPAGVARRRLSSSLPARYAASAVPRRQVRRQGACCD